MSEEEATRRATNSGLCNSITTLDKLPVNTAAVVLNIVENSAVSTRLAVLGMVKGTEVRVLRKAPFQGPISVRLLGYTLSLRLDEASIVGVSVLTAP